MTIITLALLGLVIFAAWGDIKKAIALMGQVDLWILVLLLPLQLLSYYAAGSMIFSYLRAKGNLQDMSHWAMTRLALEFNFVNHVLPSGGAAGFSYMAWVLRKRGVSGSRSTMAQVIRFFLTFVTFILLLFVAMIQIGVSGRADPIVFVVASVLALATGGVIFGFIHLVKSQARLQRFSSRLAGIANGFVKWITRGRKKSVVKVKSIFGFLDGLHDDYESIRKDRKILIKPFFWGILCNILDVSLIWISFWALGYMIDPALLFIAFGIASVAGAVSVTPGGAGVYEAVMVAFLAASGVTPGVAIAGTLLARVILLGVTILFGYLFYQLTVFKYGKRPA